MLLEVVKVILRVANLLLAEYNAGRRDKLDAFETFVEAQEQRDREERDKIDTITDKHRDDNSIGRM